MPLFLVLAGSPIRFEPDYESSTLSGPHAIPRGRARPMLPFAFLVFVCSVFYYLLLQSGHFGIGFHEPLWALIVDCLGADAHLSFEGTSPRTILSTSRKSRRTPSSLRTRRS